MNLKSKYAIGCHVMFYEIEILDEYLNSVKKAVEIVQNPENIIVELFFNISEFFEEIDTETTTKKELIQKFNSKCSEMSKLGVLVKSQVYDQNKPYCIADYRRDFNYKWCNVVDYLVWGESDCLLPREFFHVLEGVKEYANSQEIYRYTLTFALRKMWDESWRILEHPEFTDKPYYDMDTEEDTKLALNSPWSIRYTMSQDEMEKVNDKTEDLDVQLITSPKFDGSCLIMSSDLVRGGVNLPPAVSMVGDDTSFMAMCQKLMGDDYRQFVIKNILKVHNRNHPRKRLYVKDEDKSKSTHFKRRDNNWYQTITKMSKGNLNKLFGGQVKFKTYGEFKDEIKK